MRQGRVLGIDAGERRVGVALSDELRVLASPLSVLDYRQGLAPVLDALASLARREGVVEMVVGLPLNADGSRGPQARRAQEFARIASRVVGVPVSLWDERLSTQEAEAIVRAQGRNTRRLRQRGEIDAIAAAVILQDYLDHSSPVGTRLGSSTSMADISPVVASPTDAPPADASPAAGHAARKEVASARSRRPSARSAGESPRGTLPGSSMPAAEASTAIGHPTRKVTASAPSRPGSASAASESPPEGSPQGKS